MATGRGFPVNALHSSLGYLLEAVWLARRGRRPVNKCEEYLGLAAIGIRRPYRARPGPDATFDLADYAGR